MGRRTRRWRAPPPKVLSLPTSTHTELCYAFEGKAHHHGPLRGERVELLLIDLEITLNLDRLSRSDRADASKRYPVRH